MADESSGGCLQFEIVAKNQMHVAATVNVIGYNIIYSNVPSAPIFWSRTSMFKILFFNASYRLPFREPAAELKKIKFELKGTGHLLLRNWT